MKLFEFETFLNNGVKKFCFLFENSYAKDLFYEHLKKMGYTLRYVTEIESYKSQAFKSSMFEKPCFIIDYDSKLWKWLEGRQPTGLSIFVAGDAKTKAAEPFLGPSEAEYLKNFRTDLETRGVCFSEPGWNALVQRFRNQDKVIEDPRGLYNAAYSIGIQVESPDANTVNQFFGFRVKFWDLFNAIIAKDKRKTMLALHTLLAESEPVGMCGGLQSQLCTLINAKEAMQRKKSAEQFAYENKMQPYRAQMLYQQAKQLDDPSQLKLLLTLNNLELKLKSSSFFQPEEILRTGILSYFG
jgi:hypothetical protein